MNRAAGVLVGFTVFGGLTWLARRSARSSGSPTSPAPATPVAEPPADGVVVPPIPSPAPPIPPGFRRFQGTTTAAQRAAAVAILGQGLPIGGVATVDGVTGLVEWHFDQRRGWHHGVSVIVPA